MYSVYYFILYFFVYGLLGWCTEVAFAAWKEHRFVNRGFLNGPICPIYGIGVGVVVQFLTPYKDSLLILYITSVILVTALEWATGFILEKVFHNKWWDYSNMPLNLNGYVCLLFSLIWGVACVIIVDFIHPLIHTALSYIPHVLGIIIIVVFGIAMFADLYVTASGILKMNKRLAKMQEIANELHQISDKLGENIYKSTITAIEKQEELTASISEKQEELTASLSEKQAEISASIAEKQEELKKNVASTLENVSVELKEHIADLKKRYAETSTDTTRTQKRLLKAFPKMQNSKYTETFNDLRTKLKELDKKKR